MSGNGNVDQLKGHGVELIHLDVARWDAELDVADESLLIRCEGSTIDIGCGPGRLVAALTMRGFPALGVDVAVWAVRSARTAGATALHRSVFDRLPDTGQWQTALLADGNVGIGGRPDVLLARVAHLLAPGGLLLCELEPDDVDERVLMRLAGLDGVVAPPVPWARVGLSAAVELLRAGGYAIEERWVVGERVFVAARSARVARRSVSS